MCHCPAWVLVGFHAVCVVTTHTHRSNRIALLFLYPCTILPRVVVVATQASQPLDDTAPCTHLQRIQHPCTLATLIATRYPCRVSGSSSRCSLRVATGCWLSAFKQSPTSNYEARRGYQPVTVRAYATAHRVEHVGGAAMLVTTPPTTICMPHRINNFLDSVDVGDYCVSGELEAYSCTTRRTPAHVSHS